MRPKRPQSRRSGWAAERIRSNVSTTRGRWNSAAIFTTPVPERRLRATYQFAWNDDIIAANQFAGVLTSATEAIASGLDTQAKGIPIVVFNPLNIAREDVVEAEIAFPRGAPKAVLVTGPDGREVPSQIAGGKVLFSAKAPSVGYAVYDVQPGESSNSRSTLKVTNSSLENARYRVRLDQAGDVSSIYDKTLNKELLSSPIRLAISTDTPKIYPAWNMEFEQEQAPPRVLCCGSRAGSH